MMWFGVDFREGSEQVVKLQEGQLQAEHIWDWPCWDLEKRLGHFCLQIAGC